MHGLITLVIDIHVDNYLKEILAFVYYGWIVNNRPLKNSVSGAMHVRNNKLYLQTPLVWSYILNLAMLNKLRCHTHF